MQPKLLSLCLLYLFLFGLSHSYNLLQFPPTPDEIRHILRAQATLEGDWLVGMRVSMKLFHTWLIALVLPWSDNQLWAARALSMLSGGLNGLLCYALAQSLWQRPALSLVAVGVYSVLPLALFFDRMAFADSVLATLIGLTLWGSVRLWQTQQKRWAMLIGLALHAAILTKPYSAIFYLAPLSLWYLAYQPTVSRRSAAQHLLLSYGLAALAWLPVVWVGQQAYQADHVNKVTVSQSWGQMWQHNLSHSLTWLWVYLTPPFLVYALIGAIRARPLAWLGGLSGLYILILATLLNETAYVLRYLVPLVIPLSVLIAYGFMACADYGQLTRRGRVGLLALSSLMAIYLNFFLYTNPAQAPAFEVQALFTQTHHHAPYEQAAHFISQLSQTQPRPIWVVRGYTQENLFHQLGGMVSFFVPRAAPVTFQEIPTFNTLLPTETLNTYAQDHLVLLIVTTSAPQPYRLEFAETTLDLHTWPQLHHLATFPDPHSAWQVGVYQWRGE